jgi:DMSO/TMAO reductase YedYZ molybdopterin-dependent catalytic subunit
MVEHTTKENGTMVPSTQKNYGGWIGATGAALAIGLTELFAGVFSSVPSAVSSVGSYVVDYSPAFVKDFGIAVFGTADKGALAIGTAIISGLLGIVVGRAAVERPRIATIAFSAFAVIGVLAGVNQPLVNVPLTVASILLAVGIGLAVVLRTIGKIRASLAEPEAADAGADRRRFFRVVAGSTVVAVLSGILGRLSIINRTEQIRSDLVLPEVPAGEVVTVAAPAGFDVPGISPLVVPNDDFYRIDTATLVPRIDANTWTMRVHGMVDNEVELTLDDLYAMDLVEEYVTLQCVSNTIGGDLVGNALWTGVPLTTVLDLAGVQAGAGQIVGRSIDGWTGGFPTEIAYDGREPLIAVGMNGEPLPAAHGFPARLVVPGLYGYVSATKWLSDIELTSWDDFNGYWVPRGWAKLGPIKTMSRIDYPRNNEQIPGAPAIVAGVAWAPTLGIERVEVSIDNGDWIEAELSDVLSDKSWLQWKVEAVLEPGRHIAKVRATDGTGFTQVEDRVPPRPDGATGYHGRQFRTA